MLLRLEVSDDQNKNSVEAYKDFIDTVKLNGRSVQSLCDTGATKAAIRQGLEKTNQYTGKYAWCKFPNGTTARYPLANVEVEGETFRGLVEVMVVPNLLKEMIITPNQYIRPGKSKTETSSPVEAKKITTKENRGATTEVEVQTKELDNGYQESNVKYRGDIAAEEEIANYALRSQDGVKEQGVKPHKWPALKKWKLTPADVLEMQKQDPTLEKYWKMVRDAPKSKGSTKEHVEFVIKRGMLYRKCNEVHKRGIRLQLVIPEKLRERVVEMAHELMSWNPQNVGGIKERISAFFYWPSMLSDVKRHVESCELNGGGHEFNPFEFVNGRVTRDPMKILKERWTRVEGEEETRCENLNMLVLQESDSDICRMKREELAKNRKRNDQDFDRKTSLRKLDDGRVKTYHINRLKTEVNRERGEVNTTDNHTLAVEDNVVNNGKMKCEGKNKPQRKYGDYFVGRSKLNGKEVKCWYNPRIPTVVVKEELVKTEQYTGRYAWCTINGKSRRKYPLASIFIKGGKFDGHGDAIVVPGLKKDIIFTSKDYEQTRSDKVSAHSNVRENNTKSEESPRENRGGQKNYVNKRCMGNKRNYSQNPHGKFKEESQRTGRSEALNWRSKQREEVFCGREGVPCNSMGHTEAQQISLRKNFYGRNRSLRTAISQRPERYGTHE